MPTLLVTSLVQTGLGSTERSPSDDSFVVELLALMGNSDDKWVVLTYFTGLMLLSICVES